MTTSKGATETTTTTASMRSRSKAKPADENEGVLSYVYNRKSGKVLGRTGKECFQLTIFYIVLYIVLAALWALLLFGFYQTLDEHRPKYTLADSLIGTNPGLDFRPRPPTVNLDTPIIWLDKDPRKRNYWIDNLKAFLEPYQKPVSPFGHTCQGPNSRAGAGKFCTFDINKIDKNCSAANEFGYRRRTPCVLIKLNRIIDWMPQPYTAADLANATTTPLPAAVRTQYPTRSGGEQLVYITCEGENAVDRQTAGPIEYYPAQGFAFRHFPYTNQPGFLSPFVFVHFARPVPGVAASIECKAWAKNIQHDRYERRGSVHFQLLIDE